MASIILLNRGTDINRILEDFGCLTVAGIPPRAEPLPLPRRPSCSSLTGKTGGCLNPRLHVADEKARYTTESSVSNMGLFRSCREVMQDRKGRVETKVNNIVCSWDVEECDCKSGWCRDPTNT